MLGKLVSSFFDKKNDPLYNIQCSYHILRYSIVYFNENCQAAITFNNIARYLDFGRVASKDFVAYIFLDKVLDVNSINMSRIFQNTSN